MSDVGHKKTLSISEVKKALVIFVALGALFSAAASLMVINLGLNRHYVAILMWSPGIAALLTCRIMKLDIGTLGWKWGKGRWQWIAFLTPITYGLIAYFIIWTAGFGGVPDPKFLEEVGYHLGLVGWTPMATVLIGVLIFGAVGMIWHVGSSLGEEIGWRGFLTPQLLRITSFPIASLITGLAWAVWHMPIIYFTKYNAGPVDLHLQMANFTLMAVSISFIMTYFLLKTGSLWSATIIHAAHNAYILSILQPMTIQYDQTWRFANEFGFVLPLVTAAFGLYFWYRARQEGLDRRSEPTPQPTPEPTAESD